MITLVLADDHPVVRAGLRALLSAEADFSLVGEAAEGRQALALVERCKPRVLVVDLMMPGLSGLEVTRQVSRKWRETAVVVLSMHASVAYVAEALRNGACAYVLKSSSSADLVAGIRSAAEGCRFLSPPLSLEKVEEYLEEVQEQPGDRYQTLTLREREVLPLAAEGKSSAEIGQALGISPRTAEIHRANLMHKLGLVNQTELVRFALERSLLPVDEDV